MFSSIVYLAATFSLGCLFSSHRQYFFLKIREISLPSEELHEEVILECTYWHMYQHKIPNRPAVTVQIILYLNK